MAFLKINASDEDADSNPNNQGVDVDQDGRFPSEFLAGLTVDLVDPFDLPNFPLDDDKLTFDEIVIGNFSFEQIFDASLEGTANINLDLILSAQGDSRFPSISAELNAAWPFATTDDDLTGGTPTASFDNVQLNVGEFITDFAGEVLVAIQQVTEPLDPIITFLTTPIELFASFGQEVTPLDLAKKIATAFGYEFVTDFIKATADLANVINSIPSVEDDLFIPLGSFDLLGTELKEEDDLEDVTPNVTQTVDTEMELEMADEESKDFFDAMNDMGNFVPLIQDPSSVFRLLMGQTVDLLLYDMPELVFEVPFPVIRIGPIIPPYPIFPSFTGAVGARLDLAFGFDTRGWEIYEETRDVLDIFSGFFISDRENPDGTGEDVVEAALFGRLDAAGDVSVWVVSAGAGGGLTLELGADLVDPNNDGRVHFDEIVDNIEHGLTCTFDLHGEVFLEVFAFIEFLSAIRHDFRSPPITLVDFELSDSDCFPDRFHNNGNRLTATNIGIGPGLHVEGMSLETPSDEDWYEFEILEDDDIDVNVRHSNARGNIDLEIYDSQNQLLGSGQTDQDGEVVRLKNLPPGTYFARVTGSGQLNNYKLLVEPGKTSDTRVLYVSTPGAHDKSTSFYTWEAGNDAEDGLSPSHPKATLQGVLDSYQLGPTDLVVFETGAYASPAFFTSDDSGATFVGSLAGSSLGSLSFQSSHDHWFHSLTVTDGSGGGGAVQRGAAATVKLLDSDANLFQNVTINSATTGVLIDDGDNNRLIDSTFTGSGDGVVITGDGFGDARDNELLTSTLQSFDTAIRIESR